MDNIIFLDCEFNKVASSNVNTVDDWDALMMNSDYIYVSSEEAAKSFSDSYRYYENTFDSPFGKPGVYMWDTDYERWIHIWDKIGELRGIITKFIQACSSEFDLPLSQCKEEE